MYAINWKNDAQKIQRSMCSEVSSNRDIGTNIRFE